MNRRTFLRAGVGGSFVLTAMAVGPMPGREQVLAQNGDEQRTVITDALNLRSGPGLDNSVVSVLYYGQIVSIISDVTWADGYGWVQVAAWNSTASGWVAAEYLGGASGGDVFPPDTTVYVATDALNLRSGAGLGNGVIAAYSFGTSAYVLDSNVLSDGYTWVPVVVFDGVVGWFASAYLAEGSSPTAQGDRLSVTDGPLNVRSEPSLNGNINSTEPFGAFATVLEPNLVDADGYSWVKVRFENSGTEGWVATAFIGYLVAQ